MTSDHNGIIMEPMAQWRAARNQFCIYTRFYCDLDISKYGVTQFPHSDILLARFHRQVQVYTFGNEYTGLLAVDKATDSETLVHPTRFFYDGRRGR